MLDSIDMSALAFMTRHTLPQESGHNWLIIAPPPPSGVSSRNGPPIELVAATRTPFKGRVANEKATYHLGCQPASPGQDGRNSPMKYQLLRRIMVGF